MSDHEADARNEPAETRAEEWPARRRRGSRSCMWLFSQESAGSEGCLIRLIGYFTMMRDNDRIDPWVDLAVGCVCCAGRLRGKLIKTAMSHSLSSAGLRGQATIYKMYSKG